MKQKKVVMTSYLIPQETIADKILLIRGKRIMLDRDLAELYRVTTGNLNKAVKRNIERFPEDFMFKLNKDEADSLRFRFGSLKSGLQGVSLFSLPQIRTERVIGEIVYLFVTHYYISGYKECPYFREVFQAWEIIIKALEPPVSMTHLKPNMTATAKNWAKYLLDMKENTKEIAAK